MSKESCSEGIRFASGAREAIGSFCAWVLRGDVAPDHPIAVIGKMITPECLHERHHFGARNALVTKCVGGGQGILLASERLGSGKTTNED